MSETQETEEARRRRLEGQRVEPEEEVRKTRRPAEDRMESAEDQAIAPSGREKQP